MRKFIWDVAVLTILIVIINAEPKAWLIKKLEDPKVNEAIMRALIYLKWRVTKKN